MKRFNYIIIVSIMVSIMFTNCKKRVVLVSSFVNFETIAQDNKLSAYSEKNKERHLYVIKTNAEWNIFINDINNPNGLAESITQKNIDFTKHQIVAVFDEVSDDEYIVKINDITEVSVTNGNDKYKGDLEKLTVAVKRSKKESEISGESYQAFVIVKIPKTDKKVELFN